MKIRFYITLSLFAFAVVQLSGQSFTNYTVDDGLVSNVVNCVTVDTENNIWFGTNAGISRFDGESEWTTISVADSTGLIDDVITAIFVSHEGVLWVGTDFGLSRWNGTEFENFTSSDVLGNNRIQDITEDFDGNTYFANRNGFDKLNREGEWSNFSTDEGIPFGGVTSIIVLDSEAAILGLGLSGFALYDFVDSTIAIYDDEDGLLSSNIRAMDFDEEAESLWVASDAGIDNIFDVDPVVVDNHPSVFDLPPPHELNQLVDVKVDSEGIVWGGVFIDYLVNVGGITCLEDGVWTSYDMEDGLIGPVVNQLAIDLDNNVWVATSTGVSMFTKQSTATNSLELSSFNLMPNPVEGILKLRSKNISILDQPISIVNTWGQKMMPLYNESNSNEISFSVEHFDAGIYFVLIGDQVTRFIKI